MSKCLNKRKLQLEHSNEQKSFQSQGLLFQLVHLVGMAGAFSLAHLGKIHSSFIDQILNLILKIPAVVGVMSWTVRMVRTSFLRIVL